MTADALARTVAVTDVTPPRNLATCRSDRAQAARAVERLRELLERVEARRSAAGDDGDRWTARAKALEEALADGRLRVSRLDRAIRELERQASTSDRLPEPERRSPTPLPAADDREVLQARVNAVQRILSIPVFNLKDLPLEAFALARAYSQADNPDGLSRGQLDELNRRIAIYDRRQERERLDRERPTQSTNERRRQILLRQVLDKAQRSRLDHLTLGEIDLLIHAHDLLVQGHGSTGEADRLQDVLNRAIDEVCDRWTRLRDIRDGF